MFAYITGRFVACCHVDGQPAREGYPGEMMAFIEQRSTQTKVKHRILDDYMRSWGGIIINGLRNRARQAQQRGESFGVDFVYVDANAGPGRYAGDIEHLGPPEDAETIFGSPILGTRALDEMKALANGAGVPANFYSILVEKDPAVFSELEKSLRLAGVEERLFRKDTLSSMSSGQIAIINESCLDIVDELIEFTQKDQFTFSLYFLDPRGPKALPLDDYVTPIIRQDRHDALINMPYQDLHKKTGIARKETTTEAEDALTQHYDQMFGSRKWRSIAKRLGRSSAWKDDIHLEKTDNSTDEESLDLEVELSDLYKQSLSAGDPDLTVKSIGLRFPDRNRTMFYLYLTTHDPSGALQMNRVIYEADLLEHELRWLYRVSKDTHGGKQLQLFSIDTPKAQKPDRPKNRKVAKEILARFNGSTSSRKEVYKEFSDTALFPNEVDKGLRQLKKNGLAAWSGRLRHNTLISFGEAS